MNRVKRTRFWLLKPTQKSKNIQYSTVKLYCDIFTISFWFAVLLWVPDIPCMSVMSLNGMCAYQEVKNVFFFWKNLRTYLLDGTLSNRQVIVRKCLNGSFKNDVNGRQGEGVTKYVEGGSIQHSDSTNSVFYPDHLFHFSMFINRNSSCLLCYLFHDFKDYYKFANDSALNSCLYSFGLLK